MLQSVGIWCEQFVVAMVAESVNELSVKKSYNNSV